MQLFFFSLKSSGYYPTCPLSIYKTSSKSISLVEFGRKRNRRAERAERLLEREILCTPILFAYLFLSRRLCFLSCGLIPNYGAKSRNAKKKQILLPRRHPLQPRMELLLHRKEITKLRKFLDQEIKYFYRENNFFFSANKSFTKTSHSSTKKGHSST